jgi:hypothetical protein
VQVLSIATEADGSWLRTRWSFDVKVNDEVRVRIPSDLYSDANREPRKLNRAGRALVPRGQDIEIEILGRMDNKGGTATGKKTVKWPLAAGATRELVNVTGAGQFAFELRLSTVAD